MKVYLVGFMGAGKTTIGRQVARRLEVPFFDLDELVESAEGMGIKEIFAERGEPFFRKRERDMLMSTRYLESGIIATGGGTFTFDENVQFIKEVGVSAYLSAPFSLLQQRIGDKAAERPMFRDPMAAHELFLMRQKFYRLADITIEMREDQTINETAERLIMQIPRPVFTSMLRGRSA